MTSQYSTKNFQRKISIFSTLALLLTAMLVAAFSISPFYSRLSKYQFSYFQEELSQSAEQISNIINEINLILNGIANSEETGQLMSLYANNKVSSSSFLALSRKNLNALMKKYPAIQAVARFDTQGTPLLQTGTAINSESSYLQDNFKYKTETINGKLTLVSKAQIRDLSGIVSGYDIYKIDIQGILKQKDAIANIKSGEQVYLLDQTNTLIYSAGAGNNSESNWSKLQNQIISGNISADTEIFQAEVAGTDWKIIKLTPKKLIMAEVNKQIKMVAMFSFLLIVLGSVSINYLLQPLTGKLILHTNDLECEVEKKTYELQQELNQKKLAEKSIKSLNETLVVNNKIITNTLSMLNQDLHESMLAQRQALAMFEREQLSEVNIENLQILQDAIENIEKSINNAAEFASRDFDLYQFEPAHFQLDLVMDSWMNLLKAKAILKQRPLTLSIGDHIPNDLVGDPRRLGQILAYLTEYMIDLALPDSPVLIGVAKEFSKADEIGLALTVSCDGLIFSDEEVFLFNKYFDKLEESNYKLASNIPPATLVLAAKLARSHSGKIWIEVLPNQGSRFNVYLPFTLLSKDTAHEDQQRLATGAWLIGNIKPSKSTSIMRPTSEPVKILLAEDSDINQKLITSLLQKKHCEVSAVKTPTEIYASLIGKEFDMILLDTELPFANAVEIAEKIRANGNKNQIPIVALGTAADPREWHNNGLFNDYIQKPIDPKSLYKSLAKWV